MYPTISDLLYDLLGIRIPLPIQSFGFFVALSFILCAYCFTLELKRKENQGLLSPSLKKMKKNKPADWKDYLISSIISFLLGYKLVYIALNYLSFADNPQSFILSTEGNILGGVAGALLGFYLKFNENRKLLANPENLEDETVTVHPYELVANMTMISAVAGLLGAKIFHNLENLDDFMRDPVDALLSFSGLTFYGGLICGAVAVIYYARKNNIPTLHLIDACAPGLMLAYGVGRIGCQVAGDGDWGIVNTISKPDWLSFLPNWTWAYNYPHNVIGEGIPIPGCEGHHCAILPLPVFPTPLYEAIMGILLFAFLWLIRKRIKTAGILFGIYLIVNGIERFFIEKIRVNTFYTVFGKHFTQAELISVLMVIAGVAMIIYLRKSQKARDLQINSNI